MKKLSIILIVILSSIYSSYGQTANLEKEIDQALDKFAGAYNEYDGSKIISMMVKDSFFVWLHDGHLESLDDLKKITPEMVSQYNNPPTNKWIEKNIKIFNSKSAVASCKLLTSFHDNDENTAELKYIYTIVFEKKKGDWLIATIHSSALKDVRNF